MSKVAWELEGEGLRSDVGTLSRVWPEVRAGKRPVAWRGASEPRWLTGLACVLHFPGPWTHSKAGWFLFRWL